MAPCLQIGTLVVAEIGPERCLGYKMDEQQGGSANAIIARGRQFFLSPSGRPPLPRVTEHIPVTP